MDHNQKRQLSVLIALIALFVAGSIAIIIYSIFENTKSPYAQHMGIANLQDYTAGQPTDHDALAYIEYALYNTISYNVDRTLKNNEITDILIRTGSFSQDYNDSTKIHAVHFIVDIESLRQSYDVKYEWSDDHSLENLSEYGTIVSCLPVDQLIYGDFNCQDMFTAEKQVVDPIIDQLPHSELGYEITSGALDGNQLTLNIKITLSASDERIGADQAIASYKDQATAWIRSIGLDPANYTISYSIIRASLF